MKPRFLYIPWIAAHGDSLIAELSEELPDWFSPLRLFTPGDEKARRDLLSLGALNPEAVVRAMSRRLRRAGGVAHGLVLTHDWPPPLAAAARAASAAGLPTILIPHESVFFSRARFQRDVHLPATPPVCEWIFGWGGIHAETFIARGAAPERVRLVGSPKLDAAAGRRAEMAPEAFRRALGLDPARPTALFAMQPMDNAVDPPRARAAQRDAILDLREICAGAGADLIVRPPPAFRSELLGIDALRTAGAILRPGPDGVDPVGIGETIAQSALVASAGSTALIEARLMGCATLQIDYDRAATGGELRLAPALAETRASARALCGELLREGPRVDPEFDAFLERSFSSGPIGGRGAAERIGRALLDVARPVDLSTIPAGAGSDRIALFQLLRRLGASRRLAAALA